ncbi:J domain-containing protein [Sandaracinobacter neustonicus]|uniref:J domain-containing protein n=2 Tax=Sandaracinobacter neustonicus TaxID=1715348 RepID=A0A501XQV5_9SPHN|nr:J domain-containing protein [Sandaracinobacter neustonicus]
MENFGVQGTGMKAKGGAFPGNHACAHEGCGEAGDYRAPVRRPGSSFAAPSGPPEWQYFCLEHVRAFNAGWNYFDGMSEDAIWDAQTPYPSWDRETRAFAHNARDGDMRVDDALGVLRWKTATEVRATSPLSREDRQALSKLGLPDSATLAEVKATYRKLARRYHPDANKGSREHEARFNALTEAYNHLAASASFAKTASGR